MPNWQEIYKSTYPMTLKQIGNKAYTGVIETIDVVERENKGKTTTRFEIQIKGCPSLIRLNQESCQKIAAKWGVESDEWVGGKVTAKKGKVPFGEDDVSGIVVEPIGPKPR